MISAQLAGSMGSIFILSQVNNNTDKNFYVNLTISTQNSLVAEGAPHHVLFGTVSISIYYRRSPEVYISPLAHEIMHGAVRTADCWRRTFLWVHSLTLAATLRWKNRSAQGSWVWPMR